MNELKHIIIADKMYSLVPGHIYFGFSKCECSKGLHFRGQQFEKPFHF